MARSSAQPRRAARTQVVVRAVGRFAERVGWPAEEFVLARPDVIEAFCAHGMAGSTSASRGTYRSALRAWAGLADGGRARVGPGYRGARASAPYTRSEQTELCAIAAAQPPGRRSAARLMTAAGLGAGLTTSELMALRGVDVTAGPDVVVTVRGQCRRNVPVTAGHDTLLAELAAAAGDQLLFRPGIIDRGYKNAVCNFAETLVRDPAAPTFKLGRARATFICDHIAADTPVTELLQITGIVEAGSLARYAAHVNGAPTSKGAWRARWRAETTR